MATSRLAHQTSIRMAIRLTQIAPKVAEELKVAEGAAPKVAEGDDHDHGGGELPADDGGDPTPHPNTMGSDINDAGTLTVATFDASFAVAEDVSFVGVAQIPEAFM